MRRNLSNISAKIMTKTQHLRIKQNLSLSYIGLIEQIIQLRKKYYKQDSQFLNSHPYFRSQLLLYSAHHDCQNFWKLHQLLVKKNIYHQNNQKPSSNLQVDWSTITNDGLGQLFQTQVASNISENDFQKKIINYLSKIRFILQKKEKQQHMPYDNTNLTTTISLNMQMLTFGLPTVFPVNFSKFKFKQQFKQSYLLTLSSFFNQYSDYIKNTSFYRQFPNQIFNISDQPIVKEFYLRFYYENVSKCNLLQHHANLGFLAKFGLSCLPYLRFYLLSIKQLINVRNNQIIGNTVENLSEDINIGCGMFVIVRKIICPSQRKTQEVVKDQMQVFQQIKNVFNHLQLTKLIKSQLLAQPASNNQQGITPIIKLILSSKKNYLEKLLNQSSKAEEKIQELFSVFEEQIMIKKQQIPIRLIKLIDIKITRFLLLFLHFYMEDSDSSNNKNQSLSLIQKFLNTQQITHIFKNTLLEGDHLAQIVFINSKYYYFTHRHLFYNQQFLNEINNVKRLFSQIIDQIQFSQDCLKLNSSYIPKRHNDIEYLLSQQSRLAFRPMSSINSNIHLVNQPKNNELIRCLMNDKLFMSKFVIKSYHQIFKSFFKVNPKITQVDQKSDYPYLPDFNITYFNGQSLQLYLQNEICRHSRVNHSKSHKILHIRNLDQFQKQVCLISTIKKR